MTPGEPGVNADPPDMERIQKAYGKRMASIAVEIESLTPPEMRLR